MQTSNSSARRTHRTSRASLAPLTALAVAVLISANLSGCSSLYSETATAGAGIGGAAIAGQVTHNAAVATGIGLGAVAAAQAGVQYTERVVHRNTQDGIAKVAGPLDVGAVAPWSVTHSVPIEDDTHGRVTVSRTISAGALDCKEIVFSVDVDATKDKPASSAFYVASICRDGTAWKWASAEPATERWGALQ
jgi:Zn-dependent protease